MERCVHHPLFITTPTAAAGTSTGAFARGRCTWAGIPPDSGDRGRRRRRFDATGVPLYAQTFVQAFVHLQDILQDEACERARSSDERRTVTPVTFGLHPR